MFSFDDNKPFSVNLEALLDHMKLVDADMAEILRANATRLTALVRNGERNAQGRTDFNAIIATALDKLVEKSVGKDGV